MGPLKEFYQRVLWRRAISAKCKPWMSQLRVQVLWRTLVDLIICIDPFEDIILWEMQYEPNSFGLIKHSFIFLFFKKCSLNLTALIKEKID